jgi:flavin reductase (DIM6/NTAB) family NADH-FMN oxidoreductase RutF
MQLDINAMSQDIQYKLISSTVVPRPIALITTYGEESGDNAAPFSFFNVMGENPPVLVVGLETRRHDKSLKDTTINIMKNGQFVIHMVDEDLGQAMNICAIDFPTGVSETDMAGLTLAPSTSIKPKRIIEAPVAFECEKITFLQISPDRNIVVGKVLMMHVRDGLFDPKTFYIDPEKYHPIGRMFGQLYTRTRDHFKMTVPSHDDWQKEHTR